MYKTIWKFKVKPENLKKFEEIYNANGKWARLFQKAKGFLGTELLRDLNAENTFLTIDSWYSLKDFENFKTAFEKEYYSLDRECDGMTVAETHMGSFTD